MNLALWLERAGKSHAGPSCRRLSERAMLRSYGELAGRAARLAGALTEPLWSASGRPGRDRGQELCRLSRSPLCGLACRAGGGAGQRQAAWRRARLHPGAFGRARMLRVGGARRCHRAARAAEPRAPPHHRQRRIRRHCSRQRRSRRAPRDGRRSRLAVLHLGHHRPAEGRDAHATACWRSASHAYLSEVDPVAPGDPILHAAPMSHGPGSTSWRTWRGSASTSCRNPARSSRRRSSIWSPRWPRASMFAAPTMIKRLVECPADCRREISARSSGAARRCTSRTRCARSTASVRGLRRSTARARAR